MVIKSKTGWFALNFALPLTCFCVFQYGDLSIAKVLLLVVSKSICSTILDDSRKDKEALSNSGWSILGATSSTCSENSEGFICDSVGKTRVVNGGTKWRYFPEALK